MCMFHTCYFISMLKCFKYSMKALEVHMKILYTNYRTHFIPISKKASGLKEYLYHMQFGSFLLFLSLLSFLMVFLFTILEIEPMALKMPSKHSTAKLSQTFLSLIFNFEMRSKFPSQALNLQNLPQTPKYLKLQIQTTSPSL